MRPRSWEHDLCGFLYVGNKPSGPILALMIKCVCNNDRSPTETNSVTVYQLLTMFCMYVCVCVCVCVWGGGWQAEA
jgi:hypothetical protein